MTENGNAALALWRERHERVQRALAYEPVDRVPLTFLGPAYAPASQGMPLSRFCTDPEAAVDVTIACLEELGDIEGLNMMVFGLFPVHLTNQWLSRIDVPGIELPDDSIWQVHEAEVMTVADYDTIVEDGWPAFLGQLMPKLHKPELLATHDAWCAENLPNVASRYHERGYATLCSMITSIPFEALCGGRSMQAFYMDCYRIPDKVKAALDAAQQFYVDVAVAVTDLLGVKSVWVGGWRSASAMVSPKIWNELVWPYYKDLVTQLHERGIFSVLHFDQNWDRDVARFLELPRRSFAVAFDGLTDIRRAKQILGDHCAFLGDVHAATLASGTPDDVRAYVRDLIRDLGPTGLIMNSGCDIPYTSPKENVRAMVEATHEYGTFA